MRALLPSASLSPRLQQRRHQAAAMATAPATSGVAAPPRLSRRAAVAVLGRAAAKAGTTVKGGTTAKGGSRAATTRGQSPPAGRTTTRGGQQQQQQQQPRKTLRGGQQQPPQKQQLQKQQQQQQRERPPRRPSRFYFNITGFPFPLGPFFERNTVRNEVVKGQVWTFEQTQAFFFDVFTPVRMTVIKLRATGGLWVHAPVAPTDECVALLKELGAPVEHIVLPTFAYEHKVFVGPFSRRFPRARVHVTPHQWSFPLNLPPQAFGIFPSSVLQDTDGDAPWGDEIDVKVLVPPPIGTSKDVRFTEAAFFHRASRSLLLTDAVVYVERDPPACIPDAALRSQAQDGWLQRYLAGGRSGAEVAAVARKGRVEDTAEARRVAWARMSLLVLYFNPSDLLTPQASFDAIAERLIVGPVVRTLVYDKIPSTVCDWVDAIAADWAFTRVIPCHFAAPVRAGPRELRAAFSFCYELAGREPAAAGGGGGGRGGNSNGRAAAGGGLAGLFGGLFGGGGGAGGGAAGGGGGSPLDLFSGPPAAAGIEAFPDDDIAVLRGLNALLLRLRVVYADAEKRALGGGGGGSSAGGDAGGAGGGGGGGEASS